ALQQAVVQVARDAGALGQTLVVERRYLAQAEAVEHPGEHAGREHANRLKPDGLVQRWSDREIKRRSGLVPNAIVVAGDDAEPVLARRKVVVKSLAAIAGIDPIRIVTFQLVTEANLFRRRQAQGGVVDLKIAEPRGQR